jgi:hypothetical protein
VFDSISVRVVSTKCPVLFCGPPIVLPFGTEGSFPGCKAAGTSRLFLHHPVPRLQNVWSRTYINNHGVVLNE